MAPRARRTGGRVVGLRAGTAPRHPAIRHLIPHVRTENLRFRSLRHSRSGTGSRRPSGSARGCMPSGGLSRSATSPPTTPATTSTTSHRSRRSSPRPVPHPGPAGQVGSAPAGYQSAAGDVGPSMLSPPTGLRAGPASLTLVSSGRTRQGREFRYSSDVTIQTPPKLSRLQARLRAALGGGRWRSSGAALPRALDSNRGLLRLLSL
jgi:hypothetical protein